MYIHTHINHLSLANSQLTMFVCATYVLCRYKAENGELEQITSDSVLRTAVGTLEDGFRLTLWAYERSKVCTIIVALMSGM